MFTKGNYRLVSNAVHNTMNDRDKAIYLEGVFRVISEINNLANGGDLSKSDRLKLDMFWQCVEMHANSEMFERLVEGV